MLAKYGNIERGTVYQAVSGKALKQEQNSSVKASNLNLIDRLLITNLTHNVAKGKHIGE